MRLASQPPSKKNKVSGVIGGQSAPTSPAIFNGFSVFFVQEGVGKVRCRVLQDQVRNHGGYVLEEYKASSTSHIFVKKGMQREKMLRSIGQELLKEGVLVLNVEWLSACLLKKNLVATSGFEACQPSRITEPDSSTGDHVEEEIQSQCSNSGADQGKASLSMKMEYDSAEMLDKPPSFPKKSNPKRKDHSWSKMQEVKIYNSCITGLHVTKHGSHPDVILDVLVDDSRYQDADCMKVVCPEEVPKEWEKLVTWPRNPKRNRCFDQHVVDLLGLKVGNVPANLCGFFRTLLKSGECYQILAKSTSNKPRVRSSPNVSASFRKMPSGVPDRAGGGVVLDCVYILRVYNLEQVEKKVKVFLDSHDGTESLVQTRHSPGKFIIDEGSPL